MGGQGNLNFARAIYAETRREDERQRQGVVKMAASFGSA